MQTQERRSGSTKCRRIQQKPILQEICHPKTKQKGGGKKKKNFNSKKKEFKKDKKNAFTGKVDGMKRYTFQIKSKSKSVLDFSHTQEQLVRYVMAHFKRSEDIKWMIKNLEDRKFEEPTMPTKHSNVDINKLMFNKLVEQQMAREASYDEAKSKIWEVIWDQCSKALQNKLESGTMQHSFHMKAKVLKRSKF